MDDADLAIRNVTYRMFVQLGRAPTVDDVMTVAGVSHEEVRQSWQRLSASHAIVLQDGGTELRMANPFSAVPTAYRVEADGRWWYANCAWDAFGICAALHADGRIETRCPDCDEGIEVEVRDRRSTDETLWFHCLVPAAHWWDDIVFT